MIKNKNIKSLFSTLKPHTWFMNQLGIKTNKLVFNPTVPQLYEIAISKKQTSESQIKTSDMSSNGAYCAYLTKKTQKTLKTEQKQCKTRIQHQQQIGINIILHQMIKITIQLNRLQYIVDGYVGWDREHRLKVRVVCETTYHALFMKNMLIKPTQKQQLQDFSKGVDINILNAYDYTPAKFLTDGMSNSMTAINLKEKRITILGNQSASQMKKALFKVLQYYYPRKNILPLHATATIEQNGKTTLFFGLQNIQSTGLGIISSTRKLIGSDQVAWGQKGIFNIEGGCYTKILDQSQHIYADVLGSIKYGTLVENASFYPNSRNINFYDVKQSPDVKTTFPLNFLKNAHLPSIGSHPQNIILFTCDTNGVLPAIAKLTNQQAFYHFLSGYFCKINQIQQRTISTPKVKFDACFGEQHLSMHPTFYAKMLYEKIKKNKTNVWIVNTGWTQGKYGEGQKIKTEDIKKIVNDIINGSLTNVASYKTKYFKFQVPQQIEGINQNLLHPQRCWTDKAQFDEIISKLALQFTENYHFKLKIKNEQINEIVKKSAPTLI